MERILQILVSPRRPPPPPPLMNSGLLVAKETLITLPLNSFPVERQSVSKINRAPDNIATSSKEQKCFAHAD